MSRILRTFTITLAILGAAGLLVTGCIALNDQLDENLSGGDLMGTTPTSNFSEDGGIDFSMLAQGTGDASDKIKPDEMLVEVLNEDGTYTECEYQKSEETESSEFNTLALLVDDSGSMELEYPEDLYPGLCPTCPHDPQRLRATAAKELIGTVLKRSPESLIALMDFGPFVDDGWDATRVMEDFTSNLGQLESSVNKIDGSQEAGTPLWDSLAEILTATDEEATQYEGVLQLEERTDSETGEPAEVKRYLVVLSDGDDRDSVNHDLESVIALATAHNVAIYAIGLGPAAAEFNDPRLQVEEQITTVTNLQKLAGETGGFYASVNDPAALTELYQMVADGLTLGYMTETYACLPNGKVPTSGERVDGRMTIDGEITYWTMIAP